MKTKCPRTPGTTYWHWLWILKVDSLFIHSEVCFVQVQLINDAYNLVIDAMLGPEADCANIKEPYSGILVTLKQIKTPIASVDVPSGKCSYKL